MKSVALISDSHGFIDDKVLAYLSEVDEIWHAGDIGDRGVLAELPQDKVLRIVTGNIDGADLRSDIPETLVFEIESLRVLMVHIGGRPPGYAKGVKEKIKSVQAGLFVCGHSHICRVEFDKRLNCLYMNPGAIGQQGFHQMRTMLLFEIASGKIQNLRVVELGKRGQ